MKQHFLLLLLLLDTNASILQCHFVFRDAVPVPGCQQGSGQGVKQPGVS